jgi:hypothetical protein
MLSLTTLFQVCVLFLNAFAILNEDRFLRRSMLVPCPAQFVFRTFCLLSLPVVLLTLSAVGWGFPPEVGSNPDSAYVAFKGKAVQFLHAVRLLARSMLPSLVVLRCSCLLQSL